jgi:hypothetical protein
MQATRKADVVFTDVVITDVVITDVVITGMVITNVVITDAGNEEGCSHRPCRSLMADREGAATASTDPVAASVMTMTISVMSPRLVVPGGSDQ